MTQMLAQREHDYFAETAICANCYIVAQLKSGISLPRKCRHQNRQSR